MPQFNDVPELVLADRNKPNEAIVTITIRPNSKVLSDSDWDLDTILAQIAETVEEIIAEQVEVYDEATDLYQPGLLAQIDMPDVGTGLEDLSDLDLAVELSQNINNKRRHKVQREIERREKKLMPY